MNTISGRLVVQLDLGSTDASPRRLYQRRYLYDLTWKIGGAELIRRAHGWYLNITQSKQAPAPDEPLGVLGVDLGIVNLATDSDGETFSGEQVKKVRERRFQHRRRLQKCGSKNAKRRLKNLSKKEHRFQRNINHAISKRLVAKAVTERKALALEDLSGIRVRATFRRSQRRQFGNWAFQQLRQFVTYKARQAGIKVRLVDPRNTSKTCTQRVPGCGYWDKHNRRSQASFVCGRCGFAASADHNAAINISRAAVVNLPIAAQLMAVAASCLL